MLFAAEEEGVPYAILDHHAPAFSAQTNEEILAGHQKEIEAQIGEIYVPRILKSVTVDYTGFTFQGKQPRILASSIGDFQMTREQLIAIAKHMDPSLSNKKAKANRINSEDFITTTLAGYIPGMLKPILHPLHALNLSGIAYFHPQEQEGYVAFTVSPIDSIVVPISYFENHLRKYASHSYGSFTHTIGEKFDMWINETERTGSDILLADIPEEYTEMIMNAII